MTNVNSYDAHGIPAPGNVGRFQYAGQAWLAELGLYDYKARLYSPTLGRFLQTDPIGYGDGLNWYDYAGGDPINNRDPDGLDSTDLLRQANDQPPILVYGPMRFCSPRVWTPVCGPFRFGPAFDPDQRDIDSVIMRLLASLSRNLNLRQGSPQIKALDPCVISFLKRELPKRGYPTSHLGSVRFIGTMTGAGPAVAMARMNGNPAITRGSNIYTLETRFSAYSSPGPTFFSEIVHTAQYQSGDLNAALYVGASVLGALATGDAHNNHIEVFAHSFGNELSDLWNAAGGYGQCKKK